MFSSSKWKSCFVHQNFPTSPREICKITLYNVSRCTKNFKESNRILTILDDSILNWKYEMKLFRMKQSVLEHVERKKENIF